MPTLPIDYLNIVAQFAPLFSQCLWAQVQVLVVGAILTPGQRTVTAVLRIMGLGHKPHFQTYHRVLNRAVWSSWEVSRVLLLLLFKTFAVRGPLIIGIDDTIERRWGAKIKARGIYRDPVRPSHSHFVKTSGLRWLSLMLLEALPDEKGIGAGANQPLFLNHRGERLTARSIARILKRLATACGVLTPVSPHTLRHTFSTHDARCRGRPAQRAGAAGAQEPLHHPEIHPRQHRPADANL